MSEEVDQIRILYRFSLLVWEKIGQMFDKGLNTTVGVAYGAVYRNMSSDERAGVPLISEVQRYLVGIGQIGTDGLGRITSRDPVWHGHFPEDLFVSYGHVTSLLAQRKMWQDRALRAESRVRGLEDRVARDRAKIPSKTPHDETGVRDLQYPQSWRDPE